jgi:hypothetical protein
MQSKTLVQAWETLGVVLADSKPPLELYRATSLFLAMLIKCDHVFTLRLSPIHLGGSKDIEKFYMRMLVLTSKKGRWVPSSSTARTVPVQNNNACFHIFVWAYLSTGLNNFKGPRYNLNLWMRPVSKPYRKKA